MKGRPLSALDLALIALAMTLSIRWVAAAAAAGPASLPLWALAGAGFMAPLCLASAELTARFEGEGGIVAWTQAALGPLAGFVCGWLYWTCNLPFLTGVAYFIVEVGQRALSPAAALPPLLFAGAACALVVLIGFLHLAGLGTGKWVANAGAIAGAALLLVIAGWGALAAAHGQGATPIRPANLTPPLNADGAALWATMVFAFGGPEALAFLRGQVRGGIPRILQVVAVVGVLLVAAYAAGTFGMLQILPRAQISRLSGAPQAVAAAFGDMGLPALAGPALAFLALAMAGSYSAWFAIAARLPAAIAADEGALPAALARSSARTGAPAAAILLQVAAIVLFIILGQAGTTVRAAYDFLVSMSVLSYTLPFLFLFAVLWRLAPQRAPGAPWALPPGAGRGVAAVGFLVTASAVACTLVPSSDAPNKVLAITKLVFASAVLIGAGLVLWALRPKPSRR